MPKKIGINCGKIWTISKRKLITALGDYYSVQNYDVIFDICSKNRLLYDKIKMNKKLDELNVVHPKTYYYPFIDLPTTKERCVVKPRFGSRGRGISFSRFNKVNIDNLSSDIYIQYYIPFEKEYRVGIDFKRVLGIREKLGINRIRNSKSCNYITKKIPELEKFAWEVFQKFKTDFAGIDIGLWKGTYLVIELNSSPTIGPVWAKKLANDLIFLLEEL